MARAITYLLISISLTVTGCGRLDAQQPTPSPSEPPPAPVALPPNLDQMDPETVLAQLANADQLAAAGAQFAAALSVPVETVQARLQTSACVMCGSTTRPAMAGAADLALDEAAAVLAPNDGVFLFVGRFTCYYKYDGHVLTPHSCQLAPF